jgi:hypothetical protein
MFNQEAPPPPLPPPPPDPWNVLRVERKSLTPRGGWEAARSRNDPGVSDPEWDDENRF